MCTFRLPVSESIRRDWSCGRREHVLFVCSKHLNENNQNILKVPGDCNKIFICASGEFFYELDQVEHSSLHVGMLYFSHGIFPVKFFICYHFLNNLSANVPYYFTHLGKYPWLCLCKRYNVRNVILDGWTHLEHYGSRYISLKL